MSMEQPDLRALKREWTISLAVVIGGFAIAIAVAVLLTFGHKPRATIPDETQIAEPAPPQESGLGNSKQVCQTALANAKNFGALPGAGRLTDQIPRPTDQQGRYVCDAQTAKAKYSLAVDVVCKQVDKAQCVSLYSISQDDGSVLYQRQ